MKKKLSKALTENLGYKLVALFISLVLWVTILGRRDFILSKNIDVELLTSPGTQVVAQTTDHIKVKISGPRASLKKFLESPNSQNLTVDISKHGQGMINVDIPVNRIDIPVGVKILSIRPSQVQAEVKPLKEQLRDTE